MLIQRRFAAVIAGLVVATSCSLEVPADVGSINLYLDVDKGTLPVDESLTVTVTARNVGYQLLTLTGPSDCLLYIEIRSSGDLVVHNSASNCTGATVTEEIEAGKDKVQTFVWAGTNQAGARVSSGLYSIRAIARVTNDPYRGPPLTIAVE